MSQLSSAQQEGHSATESDPLGPSQVEGTIVTPGAEEGEYGTAERGAYATIRPPSPHYRMVTRVHPVACAHKTTATAMFKPVSHAWQPRAGLQWRKADQPTQME